jgi:hypothetical protein
MRVRALAVAGLSAALLTACGASSVDGTATYAAPSTATRTAPSGPELAAQAADALEKAGSVRIQGDVRVEGQEIALDISINGRDMTGTVTVAGQQVQLTAVGGAGYVHASAAYWVSQGVPRATAAKLGATWVRVPENAAAQLANVSLESIVGELRHPTDFTWNERVTTGQVSGRPVWLLTDSGGTTTTIAAEGEPFPLDIAISGAEGAPLTLSEFGAVPPITAPTDALDLSGRPA